jgi:hypothetical protein
MPKPSFGESEFSHSEPMAPVDAVQESAAVTSQDAGTVLKPFNGPTRRFPLDYVVTDADVPDLPMSRDDLKTGGFIA